MKFSKTLIIAMLLTFAGIGAHAADDAANWAKEQKAELDKINPTTLAAIAKGAPASYVQLFAEVKPDYQSSPLELTRIAALTQFMASSNMRERNQYADALVKAAQGAKAPDVACFFIDQLRWCATPQQSAAIKAFKSSTERSVAEIAAIAELAAERNFELQRKPAAKTAYAEYSEQIAKLSGSQKLKALLAGFSHADLKIAGLALREASQLDVQDRIAGQGKTKAAEINSRRLVAGKEETEVWAIKLKDLADPVRKIMLLDMLGARGNPAAADAVAACMGDADLNVAAAAQSALVKISPEAYAKALPVLLKNLPQSHATATEQRIMRLPNGLIESAVLKDYESYSQPGKDIIMSVLKNRKSASGITLATAAINGPAEASAISAYRLLRDCATEKQADLLIKKLSEESGKRLQEAHSAVAGAARRDTTGSYVTKLEAAFKQASAPQKQELLATFGRIGSQPLLQVTEGAVKDADANISTAAVRALAEWADNDSVKALMNVALFSTDNKQRILAQRGIEKKLGAKGVDKAPYKKLWEEISKGDQGDAEIKKQIGTLFGQ